MIGRKIEMIVYTDSKGNMRPIKFRVENNDGSRTVISIKSAMIKDTRIFGGDKTIRYICQSAINNSIISYEITYETRNMKWLLHAKPNQL